MNLYGLILGLCVLIIYIAVEKRYKGILLYYDYLALLLSSLIGARLFHIISEFGVYLNNPLLAFQVWKGGLSIFGAIFGMFLGLYIVTSLRRVPLFKLSDTILLWTPLAQAFGRIANYFNQELYRAPTDLPWGIYIEITNRLSNVIEFDRFHPLFAYEAILNVINFGILLYFRNSPNVNAGLLTSIYLINYGIIRIVLNPLRLEKNYIVGIEFGFLMGAVSILIGMTLLMILLSRRVNISKKPVTNSIS